MFFKCLEKISRNIYQSKNPACEASLLKSLIQHRMPHSYSANCICDHLYKFFDIIDKLSKTEINIDDNLLTVMMLYSLSSNYENFHCSIESRDEWPKSKALRIKIIEESYA